MLDFIFQYHKEILSILTIWTLAVIMPGPDFFLIVRSSIKQSKHQALSSVTGIIFGTLIWLIVGFFLINILSKTILFDIVQFCGGIYLLYMASKVFYSLKNKKEQNLDSIQLQSSSKQSFISGVFTNLSNPKPPIFISIILSNLPTTPPLQVNLLLLFFMLFIPSVWFWFVVYFFRIKTIYQGFLKRAFFIDIVAGIIFVFFGLNLIYSITIKLF
ncbi:LysE family translocator [Helicobacter anatolicus]|uniref:LysE family translocator n=1 Tax=Helicobacter anatolicus TaxID=2905874 RepID=UPI001E3CCD81|nr:LysE family translocator [Helicobacter anatolicus]MCE3039768.1 LysE family translocator [Helicobacter anatolicus]